MARASPCCQPTGSQGWQLEARSNQANSIVLDFAKGREIMTVGLLRAQGRTQILVNRMDR